MTMMMLVVAFTWRDGKDLFCDGCCPDDTRRDVTILEINKDSKILIGGGHNSSTFKDQDRVAKKG